jgi:hypothetical protein
MLTRWLLVGERDARDQKGSPRVGDLICIDGQSVAKSEFAPHGGCGARIKSVDEKSGTFVLELTVFDAGRVFEGLKLTQLTALDPFDSEDFFRRESLKNERKKQMAKAAREKRKEKKQANKDWPEQLKQLGKGIDDTDEVE